MQCVVRRHRTALSRLFFVIAISCAVCAGVARAATVSFQGKLYDVGIITPDNNVPAFGANDLMFLQDTFGNKFLVIPTDPTLRGDFDNVSQHFYVLNTTSGAVTSFVYIDGAVLDLTGKFLKTLVAQQDTTPTVYGEPLSITETPEDICIIDSNFFAYRTDGPTTTDEKIYPSTRASQSAIIPGASFNLPLHNATNPFIVYDPINAKFLTVQTALDKTTGVNSDLRHRISSFNLDGTLNSEIILDDLPAAFGFTGNTGGMTIDPFTGVIYLTDSGQTAPTVIPRKIFTFTPEVPTITSVTPSSGTFNGNSAVTVNGIDFPADAQVFFDGILASSIVVTSTSTITCVTPPHAIGAVDVTVTGSNITGSLLLSGGYTYINVPPLAGLSASPTQGPAPLAVSFNVGASTDIDGTIAGRVIDFGDGDRFTFTSDLTVVTQSHTYLANGTYTATLTVTDNLGATGTAAQVIIVGSGGDDIDANDLVLRQLSFAIRGAAHDSVKIQGEAVLPADIDLSDATVDIGYGGALSSVTLSAKGVSFATNLSLKLKLLNRRGFDPNTYTFSLSLSNASLYNTFTASGIDLTKNGLQTMAVFIHITTAVGRNITHVKPAAVINVRTNPKSKTKTSNVTLTRQ